MHICNSPLWHRAAQEALRALRGNRSQVAWSRRLGYRSATAANWEAGRRFPTIVEFLRALTVARIPLDDRLDAFDEVACRAWRQKAKSPLSSKFVAWVSALRAEQAVGTIASRSGLSRFTVSRSLAGQTTPRLPEALALIDGLTGRAAEWLSLLVEIERVPSIYPQYRRQTLARDLAFHAPWTEVVVRLLETDAYKQLPTHPVGWLSERLGISDDEEQRCLELLQEASIIRADEQGLFFISGQLSVNTRHDHRVKEQKAFWARIAAENAATPKSRRLSYNHLSCSHADLVRIEELLLSCYEQIRAIVASSEPSEAAASLLLQLVEWPTDHVSRPDTASSRQAADGLAQE